jgi:hypothetical protein
VKARAQASIQGQVNTFQKSIFVVFFFEKAFALFTGPL